MKVCKLFFEKTLDLGSETIKRMLRMRVTAKRTVKKPDSPVKISFENWLRDLPKAPSHYCRESTSKLYLTDEFESKLQLFEEYKR